MAGRDALRRLAGVDVEEVVRRLDRRGGASAPFGQCAHRLVSAACKLVAVAAGVAPIGTCCPRAAVSTVAVKVRLPGGAIGQIEGEGHRVARVGIGREVDRDRGRRAGRTGGVALVNVLETPPSLNPKTEPATSSLSDTRVPAVGDADAT